VLSHEEARFEGCLLAGRAESWQRSSVPETPGVPDRGDAGLRAANPRLRELLAEQDAEVAALRDLLKALQSQVADLAAQVKANSRNSSRLPSSDGPAKPAPKSLRGRSGRKPGRPKGRPGATMVLSVNPDKKVRHRLAKCGCCGKSLMNAPVTASAGKFALFTVHAKRGRDRMKAAGVLLSFAVQDAWAPDGSFGNVAGHALCGAHVLWGLVAAAKTGSGLGRAWAQQVIDALLALGGAAEATRVRVQLGQSCARPDSLSLAGR
jgi:hypothetical protein